ncbi:MAG TPA: type II secretion system F family protein [Candidatus Dietzia intestinigallinarum]|nr:type II secretion system F family protein [Candidatus Dietzia intestinigallinarum]
MSVLLLAVALCLAPWRSRAVERLAAVAPPRPRSRDGSARPRFARPDLWRTGPPGTVLARVANRSATPDSGPLAQLVDLLAAALTAGLPAPDALAAVADAVELPHPHLAPPLRTAAARLRLGATPAEAWQDVPGAASLAPIAAVLVRATDGGGSVRAALDHAAGRLRSDADAVATARAERASVLVAGPLGLCFLPAFVCLGVLPVVVGLADGMLPGIGL